MGSGSCSWEAALFKKPAPTLSKLYQNGRHMNITVVAIGQDILNFAVPLRGQVDAMFLLLADESRRF